jgi:hypothetical protein
MTSKKDSATSKLTVGDTVGNWTIIGEMKKQGKKGLYPCRCACGAEITVAATSLINETSLSCGCDKTGVSASLAGNLNVPNHQLQLIFDLISAGRLPPADGLSAQGGVPTWNLASIAKLIGISESQLVNHLRDSAPRFTPGITAFE